MERFLFPAKSTAWIAVLRIGLAIQVLLYALALARDSSYLVSGERSLVSREVPEAILNASSPFVPRLGWLLDGASYLKLPEQGLLQLAIGLLLASGIFLLLGLFSRQAAISAWLLHIATTASGGLVAYGVDIFTTIALFYLAIAPLPDRWSADVRLRSVATAQPEVVGFFQRVLQVHVCLIYFFGGVAKCLGCGWWNGISIWRALTRPPFDLLPTPLLARWSDLLPAAGVAILLLETLYPVFIWPRRTRTLWLAAIILMHVLIGATMGLRLFAFIMIVLNLAAFGPGALPNATVSRR